MQPGTSAASPDAPARSPLACGALGRYRPGVVAAIARGLGVPMSEAHRDRRSILMLDRPALPWGRGRRGGLLWSELADADLREPARSWQDAAGRLASCGLEIRGRERVVHSSVSGIAPIYHVEHEGATYFASRIDPLVMALEREFTVDWTAWSSVFCLGSPLEDETPFQEVRILPPFQRLYRDREGARIEAPEWPWQRPESILTVGEGGGAMLDALRAGVERLASRPCLSLLSGGLDSRLVLALLMEVGANDVRALSLGGEEARPAEAAVAAAVAKHYGIPHEVLDYRDPDDFIAVLREQALAVDFQRSRPPWIAVLGRELRRHDRIAWDGLGLDALATHSSPEDRRFYTPEMFEADDPEALARTLWRESLRAGMAAARTVMFEPAFGRAVARASRHRFVATSKPLWGHRSQAVLTRYRTRTWRGTSSLPHQALGAHATVTMPFTDDAVVRACIAMDPRDKLGFRLYDALFAGIDPAVRDVPLSTDEAMAHLPRPGRGMRDSPRVTEHFAAVLRSGPLPAHHSEELRGRLANGTLADGLRGIKGLYRGVLALEMFGQWLERYGSRLRGLDPGDQLDLESARHVTQRELAGSP